MLEFIKMFGMGILYTILSPVILLFFLLFVVYSVFNYLVCEAIYLGGFFLGKRFDDKTELEKTYAKMKKEREEVIAQHVEVGVSNEVVNEVNSEDGDYHA